MPSRDLIIEIKADTKKAIEEIEELKREIEGLSDGLKKADADKVEKSLQKVNSTSKELIPTLSKLTAIFGGGFAIKSAIQSMAEFEASLSKLGAISQASKAELSELRDKALELGAKTQYSATQVTEGMNYLAMAGFKTNDILNSTADVLNLATIGQIDLGRASDIASNILSGFGLKASELSRVVDVMTATITNSNTNIEQMGEAMKYAAPSAKALGVSVEELSTAIGILGNAGIQGSLAGTGLAQMFTRLASPVGEAKKLMDELGIKVFDANGKFIGLTKTLKLFAEKTKNLSQQDRLRVYKTIFGEEALKDVLTLTAEVDKSYSKLNQKIQKSAGLSAKVAKQIQDNLKGDWEKLVSAINGLVQAIGEDLIPALRDLVQWLTNITGDVTEFYKEHRVLIKTIAELSVALIGLNKVFKIYGALIGSKKVFEFINGIRILIKEVGALKYALMALEAVNPVLLAISATLGVILYKINKLEEETRKLNKMSNTLDDSTNKLNKINSELKKLGGGLKNATKEDLEKIKKEVTDLYEINEKRLKQLKKENDNTREQKEVIAQLTNQQNALKAVLAKVNEKLRNKDYLQKKVIQNSKNEIKAIHTLSKEEKKYLNSLKNEYQKRINSHSLMIERLKEKEKSLTDKILELNKELNNKLKSLENARIETVTSIEDKIHNLQISNLSDYEKYKDKQLQAEKKFSKAKEALEKGNFELAKNYMSQYRNLVESLANTEIKNGKRVLVSKEESNKIAIAGLKKLENLTNEYYAKQKQKAIQLHNQKVTQLKAELQATKAQLQLEVERLNLEKQMIELLTGKKVEIDTTSALNSIKELDKEIKALDSQIKKKKEVKVDADTKEADKKVDKQVKKIKNTKADIFLGLDDYEAKKGILKIKDEITGKEEVLKITADTKNADFKIEEIKEKVTTANPKLKINPDASRAFAVINKLKQPTSSVHTIYIREVKQSASGGLIKPVKRATGGDIDLDEFKRINGRIPGYDPQDKDDVPALLTRGEFVIKREAVAYYGDSLLWALNNKALPKELLPKFYTGGVIGESNTPKAQQLITEIKTDLPKLNLKDDLESLISKIETLLNSVKDKEMPFIGNLREELNRLKSLKVKFDNDKKEYENLTHIKKVFTKEEFNSYKSKVEKRAESLKNESEKIETEKEKIEAIFEKVSNFLEEVKEIKEDIFEEFPNLPSDLKERINKSYNLNSLKALQKELEKIDEIKQKIEDKLLNLNIEIPKELSEKVKKSFDLKKLENFYKSLNSNNLVKPNEINKKYNEIMKKATAQAQAFYYSPTNIYTGKFAAMMMERFNPSPYNLFNAIGIKHPDEKLINEIPTRIDYRTFGGSYSLSEKVLNDLFKRELLDKLPKFRSGGLLELANGGKLAGYGGGDRNLALLEDGEYVIRKEAVSLFGVDLFNRLNNLQLPKFQVGGLVGNLPSASNSQPADLVNVNFILPSGKSFTMQSSEAIAKAFASELKRIM